MKTIKRYDNLKQFISESQLACIHKILKGEEGEYSRAPRGRVD
jgi:hypothetical protein